MSFIKLDKSLFETSTIILRNKVTYTSSSSGVDGVRKISKRALQVRDLLGNARSMPAQYSDSSITKVLNTSNDSADKLLFLKFQMDNVSRYG